MNMLNNKKFQEVMSPESVSSSIDTNSDRLDMQGYDGVVFILPITDSVATGIAALTVEQSIADSDTDMAELTGAEATKTCTTSDDINDLLLVVDVYRPRERYVQGVAGSSVANIAFGNMIAIQYKGSKAPITQPASVADSASVYGPDEA